MKLFLSSLFALFLITHVAPANAQRTVSGLVIAEKDAQPLVNVSITLLPQHISTTTNLSGRFSIRINDTVKSIKISCLGFEDQTLVISDKNNYQIKLRSLTSKIKAYTAQSTAIPATPPGDTTSSILALGGKKPIKTITGIIKDKNR